MSLWFISFCFIAWTALMVLAGCDRPQTASGPTTRPSPTVASLSPAATDLIVGMGAGDRLVAVSNYDVDRPGVSGLPRVGDYRNIDWERLSGLRPDVLVIQVLPEKVPPAVRERAAAMNLRLVNIRIDRLDDVFTALHMLGDALGTPDRAAATEKQMREGLDAVRRRVAGKPTVRVYLARDANGLDTVGGGNFMDDLLTLAGGQNVMRGGEHSYPTIDREKLLELDPDVVLQLLPAAAPQVKEQAKQFWAALPQLSAVKNGRVYVLDDYYVLQPGPRVADTAARFADLLHPVKEIEPRRHEDTKRVSAVGLQPANAANQVRINKRIKLVEPTVRRLLPANELCFVSSCLRGSILLLPTEVRP